MPLVQTMKDLKIQEISPPPTGIHLSSEQIDGPHVVLWRILNHEGIYHSFEAACYAARTLMDETASKMSDKNLPVYGVRYYSEFYVDDALTSSAQPGTAEASA